MNHWIFEISDHVAEESKAAGCNRVDLELRHLLPTPGRLERQTGNYHQLRQFVVCHSLSLFCPCSRSLIPRTTWRLLKTDRSTPPLSSSPWNRVLGSASWPTMPATSFIGELQKVLRIVQPSRIITFFFIFCFIQRVDFSKGVEKFFFGEWKLGIG